MQKLILALTIVSNVVAPLSLSSQFCTVPVAKLTELRIFINKYSAHQLLHLTKMQNQLHSNMASMKHKVHGFRGFAIYPKFIEIKKLRI